MIVGSDQSMERSTLVYLLEGEIRGRTIMDDDAATLHIVLLFEGTLAAVTE